MSSFNHREEKLNIKEQNKTQKNFKLNEYEIKLIQRTLENNTHESVEDKRLKSITSWRKSNSKFYKILIFNILSFGILHLISLHYPYLYIKLYCNPWPAKECDFFLVENIYGQYTLCVKNHKKSKNNNEYPINSDNIDEKINSSLLIDINNKSDYNFTKNLTYSFKYKSMNYEYDMKTNEIVPVYMDLSKMTNKKIINFFCEGLSSQNLVNKIEERYGKNEYFINPNLIHLYFKRVELPSFIIILIIGIMELILKDYISCIIKIIFISLIIIQEFILESKISFNKYKKENTLDGENKLKVKRKYLIEDKSDFFVEINNKDLLPGDILYLKSNDLVPCDCIIIEGECIANQSELNGNLDIFKKIPLIENNNQFNYENNKINILLHGMKIIKTFSKIKGGYISVLCINTGPNTYKANQYSNILYLSERKRSFKEIYTFFGDDRKIIFIGIIFLFFVSIGLGAGYMFLLNMNLDFEIIKNLIIFSFLRTLFKSFMPVYFFTHSIILILSLHKLKNNNNIICFDKSRLLHSYNIKTIFFGKTNILCENKFEITSYNPVNINIQKSYSINFRNYNENQCKEMNIQLLKYYKEYILKFKYDTANVKNNNGIRGSLIVKNNEIIEKKILYQTYQYTALFLECLLSCNNLERINNEIFGNIIETKIFNDMKWEIRTYDSENYILEDNQDNRNNINYEKSSFTIESNKNKYDFDNNYNLIDKKISDIYPKNYYKITESLKKDIKKLKDTKRLKSKVYKKLNTKNESINNDDNISKSRQSININPILEDISQTNINSYKLRVYKRFIKNGTLISSAIVYNFITKELRFMTKGIPEDIISKCDINSLPENFERTISLIRRSGYIIIICATKLIDLEEYNDFYSNDYYMNNLTFCGFLTLKNKEKNDIKSSIKELRQYSSDLIISSGDNLYNCLSVGFNSTILENKNFFIIEKDDKNKIIINKILDIKSESKNENKDSTSDSLDKYSKQTTTKVKNDTILKYDYSYNHRLMKKKTIKYSENSKISKKEEKEKNEFQSSHSNLKDKKLYKKENKRRKESVEHKTNNLNENKEFYNSTIRNKIKNYEKLKYENISSINLSNESENKFINNLDSKNFTIRKFSLESNTNRNIKEPHYIENNKNINTNINKRKTSCKNNIEQYLEKHYYYPRIFKDFEQLTSNCIYCINGKTFNYLYENKNKKEFKNLLYQIYKNCKVFYQMSSIDKSLSVEFFKENNDGRICYIGETKSDSDPIITSNIGINFKEPKNQNTIFSHFYTDKASILCIKNIILEGKSIHENIIFLKISSIFCTMVINSYILCCFICQIDAMIGQLNILELTLLIFSITAFTGKSNSYLKKTPFTNNIKLFVRFYVSQTIGLFIIKLASIYLLCINYLNPNLTDGAENSRIFCTFYFILCLELIFSSIFVFNSNSFNRKNFFDNNVYIFYIFIFFIYVFSLITLNSSNFSLDLFNITHFEHNEELIDSSSDKNKLLVFNVFLIDFGVSFVYSRMIYYIFEKISKRRLKNIIK